MRIYGLENKEYNASFPEILSIWVFFSGRLYTGEPVFSLPGTDGLDAALLNETHIEPI